MDILLALFISFCALIFSALKGYFVGYPLLVAIAIFISILIRRGFQLPALLNMAVRGSQKSLPVLKVLLLIGAVTSAWMAAGTVPTIVYYGIQWISPQWFVLAAFGLTSVVSLLIGTSFGAVSTVGMALMIMANGSGANSAVIAGAIIAGAYVGDRCSPMSSSAILIASITQTQLYSNIRAMWKTALLPLGVSLVIYTGLSLLNPVRVENQTFLAQTQQTFHIAPIALLPALIILLLSLAQVSVTRSMLWSIGGAIALAIGVQHYTLLDLIRFMTLGFRLNSASPLYDIFKDGGIVAMLRVSVVVILSTAFVGIFAETQILDKLNSAIVGIKSRRHCFFTTCWVGIATATFGCTQTIAILLTEQLVTPNYGELPDDRDRLALDLENTVVVLSPLIPWNIAGLVPATVLHVGFGFVPFACYLYLLPLISWAQLNSARLPSAKPNG